MSIESHFVDTADVLRATPVFDEFGQEVNEGNYSVVLAAVTGRFVEKSERVANPEGGFIHVKTYKYLVAPGTDIRPADRLTDIVIGDDENPNTFTDQFLVEQVINRRWKQRSNHIAITLERIQ